MAAAALEQSVLESKDKDTLLEMAKALGVKASSRLKKADIIDKILDTTSVAGSIGTSASSGSADRGGASARSAGSTGTPADTNGSPSAGVPSSGAETNSNDAPAAHEGSDSPASAETPETNPDPPVGADGEPLADWELELTVSGESSGHDDTSGDSEASSSSDGARGEGSTERRGDDRAQRSRGQSGEQRQSGKQQNGQGRQQGGTQQDGAQQGNQGNQGNQGGGNRGNQSNNQQGGKGGNQPNNQQGEGNSRRRRRRRKGRGQEGPQGEDAELLDTDDQPQTNEPVDASGYLDIRDEGYGFLRVNGYLPSKDDAYIPLRLARQYGLRRGDQITGKMRPAGRNEKNPALLEIHTINGADPEAAKHRPRFEDLTALFPDERLTLEDPSDPTNMTARIIDLVSPIGKGQRGIIVSPPKAGKTTVMKTIAKSIELNSPDVELMVLLIDERPEEVTDMRRSVQGEVISSTFDRPSDEHTHVAEMAIAKAKRSVEAGNDVVVILDGITRLSRAYNLAAPASGRILSGGIDAGALYPPKKFFGAARNIEEGGSLTILATALVDTNSRMDEAIFEEFKGTGNMELRLDRKISERRIYPAIDVDASSTRHEELLFDRKELQMVWKLRRVLSGLAAEGSAAPGLELLIDRLKTFRTNAEFLSEIAKQPGM
ncbi:MAG: transcription termination factor Rho [Acidimicrobiia bacterium]|nr:transcription termination factor Rho [Acidimicrobiia bacterium]